MPQEDLQLADWSLVPDIIKILETDFPHSLPFCKYLEFYAYWRENGTKNLDPILLTPGGKVNEYGTFVLYVHGHNYNLFYSLNPDWKELKSLLISKGIPWDKNPIWGPIHERFQPVLDELYEEGNMKQVFPSFIGSAYLIDINKAKNITYTCPPEVYLGPLKEEQCELIDSFWPLKDHKTVPFTRYMIRKNGGLGLYLKESNDLIAWCLIWTHNGPGQLYVSDKHKRKGYGTLLANAITKLVAENGIIPLIFIHRDNAAGQQLWKRIGYEKHYGVRWSRAVFPEKAT